MATMFEVFFIILPVFLIIGAGMLADRMHLLPSTTSSILSAYLLRLGLPMLMVNIMGGASPEQIAKGGFWFTLIASQFVVYMLGYLGDLFLSKRGQGPAVMTAMASSCCNAAFLGMPIIFSLFPNNPEALLAAGIATVTPSLTMVVGQAHLEILRQKENSDAAQSLGRIILRSLFLNPLLMGLVIGLFLGLSGIGLWAPLEKTAGMIGSTCAPCALVALGLDMRTRLKVALRAQGHVALHQAGVIFVKLVIHPLLAWALLAFLGFSGLWLAVGVIMCATASGVGVYMMGESYNIVPEESALSVVLTNGLALFTMSAFACIFKILGAF